MVVVVVVVVVICLAVNDMGAEGATAIATAVSGLPMLREWNISSTCVTGAWTPIVVTQRGPAAIVCVCVELLFAVNNIYDSGAVAVAAAAARCQALAVLDVSGKSSSGR